MSACGSWESEGMQAPEWIPAINPSGWRQATHWLRYWQSDADAGHRLPQRRNHHIVLLRHRAKNAGVERQVTLRQSRHDASRTRDKNFKHELVTNRNAAANPI